MAGIDNLKVRLLQEDRLYAEAIEAEAVQKSKEIMSSAMHKAEDITKSMGERAHMDGREKRDRLLARAALNARNSLLEAKQEAIEKILTSACEKIENMDENEYSKLLERMLLSTVETGEEEIIFDEDDLLRIDKALIRRVNKSLRDKGISDNVKLSSERRSIKSGFILKRGDLEINCSIEAQIKSLREELEGEIAAILFS